MPLLLRSRPDTELFDLLERTGANTVQAAVLLRDLLDGYPERADLASALIDCEHEGDRLTHDFIHRLRSCHPRRCPFDASDGHQLAGALDDIVDFAEEAADTLGTHQVEAPMEQAVALAAVLLDAAHQIAGALAALRGGGDLSAHLVEIHRLENEGDRLSREGVASLFANGIDPMVVIRWKDVFDSLEAAVDACERVANLLEGITLRRR